MSGQIFISYRREDASHPAGRLRDLLSTRFPQSQIFLDVDNIPPGANFVEAIQRSAGACNVLIAVIGKSWLAAADEQGNRRLDNPEDFVRTEIATALERGIRVIPVLVDGASMPRLRDLPDDLKPLVRRQALRVGHDHFRADSEPLITAVNQILEAAADGAARPPKGQENEGQTLSGTVPDPSVSVPKQMPSGEDTAKPKKPWRLLVEIGSWRLLVVIGGSVAVVLFMMFTIDLSQFERAAPLHPSHPSTAASPAAADRGQPASAEVRAAIGEGYDRLLAAVTQRDLQAYKAVHTTDFVVRDGAKVTNAQTHFSGTEMMFALGAITVTYHPQDLIMTAPDTAVATVEYDVKNAFSHTVQKDRDVWKRIGNQWLLKESDVLEKHILD